MKTTINKDQVIEELRKENQTLKNRLALIEIKNELSIEDKMQAIKQYFEFCCIDSTTSLRADDYTNIITFEKYLKGEFEK